MVTIPNQFRFVTASQINAGKCYPQMTHDRERRNGKYERCSRHVADSGTILNIEMEIKMS